MSSVPQERSARLTRLKLLRIQRQMLETREGRREGVKEEVGEEARGSSGRSLPLSLASPKAEKTIRNNLDIRFTKRRLKAFDGSHQIGATELNDYLRVTPSEVAQREKREQSNTTNKTKLKKLGKSKNAYIRLFQLLLQKQKKTRR